MDSEHRGGACFDPCCDCCVSWQLLVESIEDERDEFAARVDSTRRILFHVVRSYEQWRDVSGMMPNELTDDAVRLGRDWLKSHDWWPLEEALDERR